MWMIYEAGQIIEAFNDMFKARNRFFELLKQGRDVKLETRA